MPNESASSALTTTLQLARTGRFLESLAAINRLRPINPRESQLRLAHTADLLQRTGNNAEAERIALDCLKAPRTHPETSARCHLALGSIRRERGDLTSAIGHLQTALKLADSDLELSCWIQLRLLASIADLAGGHTAMARLSEVKRSLTRLGDARPLCALHLWIAEVDTTAGRLDTARNHLRVAQSLLSTVEDLWLQGYFAINSFCLSYSSAEIAEARKWADVAVASARLSGHAGARRAAYANLGQIEFDMGHTEQALECYYKALECSEPNSQFYLGTLDCIAQIKLHLGQLDECQGVLTELEQSSASAVSAKAGSYRAWALQTRIQLLLRQDRVEEAKNACQTMELSKIADPRLRATLGLLFSEVYAVSGDFSTAAANLSPAFSNAVDLAPDQMAEAERVIAKSLSLSGLPSLGRIHLERAIKTFDAIGHAIGKAHAVSDAASLTSSENHKLDSLSSRTSLDRVRALLETRQRPELFRAEASRLLTDLNCAVDFRIGTQDELIHGEATLHKSASSLRVTSSRQKEVCVDIEPRKDFSSILSALTFKSVIERILGPETVEAEPPTSQFNGIQVEDEPSQGAIFAAESTTQILKTINKIATTNLSVLITGETGTGKEVIARTIHERSDRQGRPFTAINCAAVPRDLLESQLFGYRRGAFSGAHDQFPGIIRATAGGTLLLDEVGDIPLDIQPKLLRFLESGEIHPLGESRPIEVDVRLILATNANLEQLVSERRFREDLFFRVNVIHLRIPPLRERREEIPPLVQHFLIRYAAEQQKGNLRIAEETMEYLFLYHWPGNVRQLANEMKRIVALAEPDTVVLPEHLAPPIAASRRTTAVADRPRSVAEVVVRTDQPLSAAVQHLERAMLEHALKKTDGRVEAAAKLLGVSRKGLYLKRQRLGLDRPQ